jgi:peptidylprolyl isomerase
MKLSRQLSMLLLLLAAIALVACGGDEGDGSAGEAAAPAEEESPDGADADVDLEAKPEVEVPEGPPPDSLEVEDIVEGDGDAAAAGDLLAVEYVGVLYENGEEFDSSYERGEPFQFQLGAGMVIQGWDEGLEGMKVGGRRELTIPPDLAYGPRGSPPAIGPDETLVFVIDLVEVQ